jgi:hypothetical protein
MIRVRKCESIPSTLQKGYNTDEVCRQLLADQDEKCYLCERHLHTNYQVEHLSSQNNTDPELVNEWGNLYAACEYCNNKKSDRYDSVLHPDKCNIEEIILHHVDFMQKKVYFESDKDSSEVLQTIQLLSLLFNGKLAFRTLREQRFYDEFIRAFNVFQGAVNKYLDGCKEEYYGVIKELLDIKSEYLGFKYAIIMNNSVLRKDFGGLIKWNKQGK